MHMYKLTRQCFNEVTSKVKKTYSKPKLFVIITSEFRTSYDMSWVHKVTATRKKPIENEDSDVYQSVYEFNHNGETGDKVFVLFHFHENYCDMMLIYSDEKTALSAAYKRRGQLSQIKVEIEN